MRLKSGKTGANSLTSASNGYSNSREETLNDINGGNSSTTSGGGDDDLDMDSGDDEIDVGTNADSMMINYNNSNGNTNNNNSNQSANSSSAMVGINNDHNFGAGLNGNQQQSQTNFLSPQQTTLTLTGMTDADRKRAHHNALERKRRDHIKDSFHTLRDAIPNIKGEKVSTSRAQILKAATEYIKSMRNRNNEYQSDIDSLKKQNYDIEVQIRQLEKAKLAASQYSKQQNELKSDPSQYSPGLNSSDDLNTEFKYETNENLINAPHQSINTPNSNNIIVISKQTITHNPNTSNILTTNATSKKYKTIINSKTNANLLNTTNNHNLNNNENNNDFL